MCLYAYALAEFDPFPYNRGTIYEYADEDVEVMKFLFFPADKSRWNGYEATNKNWHQLTDYQKFKFLEEGQIEIIKQEGITLPENDTARLCIFGRS